MENQMLGPLRLVQADTLIYKGLTLREVEVLKWSAEGKTAAEVAVILDLKTRTVNFHIGSAIRKIGVSNKTSAVVQAALSGVF
jgi:LuxR family transcriptional regulator